MLTVLTLKGEFSCKLFLDSGESCGNPLQIVWRINLEFTKFAVWEKAAHEAPKGFVSKVIVQVAAIKKTCSAVSALKKCSCNGHACSGFTGVIPIFPLGNQKDFWKHKRNCVAVAKWQSYFTSYWNKKLSYPTTVNIVVLCVGESNSLRTWGFFLLPLLV